MLKRHNKMNIYFLKGTMGRIGRHESKYVWTNSTKISLTKTFPSEYVIEHFSDDFSSNLHPPKIYTQLHLFHLKKRCWYRLQSRPSFEHQHYG